MASVNFLIKCRTIFQLGVEMYSILQTAVKKGYFASEVWNSNASVFKVQYMKFQNYLLQVVASVYSTIYRN
jgi:hypothetical protein